MAKQQIKQQKLKTNIRSILTMIMSFHFFSFHAFATQETTANKVLIVISSDKHGYWLPEVLGPYRVITAAGFDIDIASPKGGQGTSRGAFQLSSKQTHWLANSTLKSKLAQSLPLSAINSGDYVAVYFAGGAGPMFDLADNPTAQKITREIYEAGGIISADCHGPVALVNVRLSNGQRLIAGKAVTGKANIEEGRWARKNYPFLLEDKLIDVGGNYSAGAKGKVHVVIDQRIVTGQNPASAIPMAHQLIEQLSLFMSL